jgi:hypothetical protein
VDVLRTITQLEGRATPLDCWYLYQEEKLKIGKILRFFLNVVVSTHGYGKI